MPAPEEALDLVFAALGDRTRRAILTALMAGGRTALVTGIEGAEDDEEAAARDGAGHGVTASDAVVYGAGGISHRLHDRSHALAARFPHARHRHAGASPRRRRAFAA